MDLCCAGTAPQPHAHCTLQRYLHDILLHPQHGLDTHAWNELNWWLSQECKLLGWYWHQSYHPVHCSTALQSQYLHLLWECSILLSCLPYTADSAAEQLVVVELQLLEPAAAVAVELLEQPAVAAAPSESVALVDAAVAP